MLIYRYKTILNILFFVIAATGLYFISRYNYILFHTFSELFSITIAWCFFIIVWNTRQYIYTDFFMVIAVSSLFTGGIDLLHTLSYKGLNIFPAYDSNLPTQLWIAARYLSSISLLFAVASLYRPVLIFIAYRRAMFLTFYFIITSVALIMIFLKVFPDCYIEDRGLTSFKKLSEYIIIFVLAVSGVMFHFKRRVFEKRVYVFLALAIVTMIFTDLFVIFYIEVYDFSNFLGHVSKVFAYYLLYLSIVKTGLEKPFKLLFRDLKKSEESYMEINTYLKNLIAYANVPIIVWDSNLQITEYNMAMERLIGLQKADVLGKELKILFKNRENDYKLFTDSTVNGVNLESKEIPIRSLNGDTRTVLWNTAVIKKDDRSIAAVIGQGIDITERRNAELEIRNHLHEKEIILKEVHHRIKNNMNTISNLLMLQVKSTSSDETISALENARSRIRSMMSLYDTLFISGNYRNVSTRQYLENLIKDIDSSYNNNNVKISTYISDLDLPPEILFPVGMIINELVMNSIKYAFPGYAEGEIAVSVAVENDNLILTVKDNGIGIIESTGAGKSDGFGLNLILLLTDQISGKIERIRGSGTVFRLTVKL